MSKKIWSTNLNTQTMLEDDEKYKFKPKSINRDIITMINCNNTVYVQSKIKSNLRLLENVVLYGHDSLLLKTIDLLKEVTSKIYMRLNEESLKVAKRIIKESKLCKLYKFINIKTDKFEIIYSNNLSKSP